MKSLYSAMLVSLAMSLVAAGQVPQSFEIVEVAASAVHVNSPQINDCGQIVYHEGFPWTAESEVFLCDEGSCMQLSTGAFSDSFAEINESGAIAWTHNWYDEEGLPGDIMLWGAPQIASPSVVGIGHAPRINDSGHIVWVRFVSLSCPGPEVDDLYYYDGDAVVNLISNGLSNQSPKINNADQITWTRFDFPCGGGFGDWTSDIMLLDNAQEIALPATPATSQQSDINDLGDVVWATGRVLIEDTHNIELWRAGVVTEIIQNGINPRINNHGEIYFIRFDEELGAWQPYLYRPEPKPAIYRLLEEPLWNTDGDINNLGECVWAWSFAPTSLSGGIRYMRRMRTGDTDFDDAIGASDFTQMPGCLTGPYDTDRLCDCRFYDMDHDRDVDLRDVAAFQVRFGLADAHLDYCHAHGEPGTNDPAIAACVCEAFPFCCDTTTGWVQICVDAVEALGCGRCGG